MRRRQDDMSEDERKHDVRQQAHEAGIEGASKLSTQDAQEALSKVQQGEDPQQAKEESRD
jgi:hypothetical protein